MAEKTVSVRLKLIHDQYMKAAQEAGRVTNNVVKADHWQKLGKETSALGDKLTRNVTLPIVGVGVAATKMALDFDAAFVQMQTLAGVSADEVDALKDSVLDLAGETGKAPQELAEALYFIQSAGLSGEAALEALEASAKGAAAGLGSTIQVADAVTNAINGYGQANITASEATDVLVATAREGKAEASELAPQFGRLIPIAAELGISFDQLGGGMAFLTRASGDTSLAATQLSGVLAKLLEPGAEGAEALEQIGMSADGLRQAVREKGLHQALLDLRDNLEANGLQLNDFSVDQQFLQGALQLTGASAQEAADIFAALEDSAGATDDAFAKWAESMGAKNAKAFAEFQAGMIRLGDILAPIATDMISFAASLIEVFDKLPDPVKKVAAGLVIVAAAAGPLLSIGGRLITTWATLSKLWATTAGAGAQGFADAMNNGAAAAGTMNTRVGALIGLAGKFAVFTAAIVAAGAALDALFPVKHYNLDKVANDLVKFEKSGRLTGEALEMLGEDFEKVRTASEHLFDASFANKAGSALDTVVSFNGAIGDTKNEEASRWFKDLDKTLASIAEADPEVAAELFSRIESEMKKAGATTDDVNGKFEQYTSAVARADTATELAADSVQGGAEAFDEEATAADKAAEALGAYADALRAQFDPLFALVDAHKGVTDARLAVEDATGKLSAAEKEFGSESAEAAAAARDLAEAEDAAVGSAYDLESAQINLAKEIENGNVSLDDAIGWLDQWVADGRITQSEADKMAFKFAAAAGALKTIPREWNTNLKVSGVEQSIHDIGAIQRHINSLRGTSVPIRIVGTAVGVVLPGGAKFNAKGGRVRKGEGSFVGEEGMEWFEPDSDGTIIPNHLLGKMSSQGSLSGLGGGGAVVSVMVDMRGAIVSSKADAERWIADGWNRAAARNMVTVRGRPL